MRILVVEDEKKLAGFIRRALKEDGHAVDLCHDGRQGRDLASKEDYDAVVLDLMLPGVGGLEVLQDLREQGRKMPVLVLTARDSVEDRVKGLDRGADDYLTKPFALDELRARLRALLRRGKEGGASTLRFADVTMDLLERSVRRGSRSVVLTAREFALLEYFLRHPRRVLTRTSIAEHVWDYSFDWQSNVVDVFIAAVRRKLEEQGEPRLIHTLRGVGYVLRESGDDVD
ncbi:MAG TPA: response regulator transcription factor [Planctomycetota bacterium]|jgi:DNA-binding response OmpR family regulator|nr:response regulator transcription factor [Planctomycetota bacterium]